MVNVVLNCIAVKCTGTTAVVAYAPVHMDWNFTEPEPLKCYSCQSEDFDDVCMHMNNTDIVPTLLCPAHQTWCKVRSSPTNSQKRLEHPKTILKFILVFQKVRVLIASWLCWQPLGFFGLRGTIQTMSFVNRDIMLLLDS